MTWGQQGNLCMFVFFDAIKSFRVTSQWPSRLTATMILAVMLLSNTSSAFAYDANECAGSRFNSDLVCTAGDVSITGIAVAPGTPTACIGGTTFTADLDITVNFATPDRWDIGIFLSNDGNDQQLLPANGGANTCSVGILPNSSPFFDLDPNGGLDTCGDGNGTISGGTGAGVVRLYDVPVSCQAIADSGGGLYIPFVVSWDNQSSPSGADCTSILDPVPNTKSKCNAPNVSNPVEVLYGTVDAIVLPEITKTNGITAVNPGDILAYTVVITNTTGQPLSGAVFTDPDTANLTVTSVTCSAAGGATCPTTTIAAMQVTGITIPDMPEDSAVTFTIGATVANPVSPSHANTIINTANVTVQSEINSATDTDDINGAVFSDLSTSTKTVIDLNGGEADPGDVLRYTITLIETAGLAVTGASVTDDIPPYVNNFTVVSTPTGATDSSTGAGTGSNNTGYLDITGINISANGSETIVFDVTVATGTPAGTTIDNFATVNNPGGPGGTPSAPTVTVSPSAIPKTGNKKLYLYSTSPNTLSRNLPAGTPTNVTLNNSWTTWAGTSPVPLQQDNTVQSAYATLFLSADSNQDRKVEARMYCSSNPAAYATSGIYNLGTIPGTPTPYTFNLTTLQGGFAYPATCTAGNHWILRVDSHDNKNTTVYAVSGTENSRLNLDSSNIIYVENLDFYDAAYPGGATITSTTPNTTIYIRSTISDPFGSFDIDSALIDIRDPNGTSMVTADAMTEIPSLETAATKTYEYAYLVPVFPVNGHWSVTVTANEGKEGTVTDDRISAFSVVTPPNLTMVKSANGTTDADPGDVISYTLTITNSGAGLAFNVVVTDAMSPYTALALDPYSNGTPFSLGGDSGLSIQSIDYANGTDGGGNPTFGYTPISGGGDAPNGYDGNITHWQTTMDPADSVDATKQFTLDYQTIVK